MPAKDVTVTGSFSINKYKLTYKVDGEVYKTIAYDYGDRITPESAPTKVGYTFSGWSAIPSTMPSEDVTITGSFTVNKYRLTYKVDGDVYITYDVDYGEDITPESAPMKDGYTFSGWSYIPSIMPAEDVTIIGSFIKKEENDDDVSYEVQGSYAVVVKGLNATGELIIKATVEIDGKTYDVVSIAEGAFQGCTGLTSVQIPNSITSIGKNAFEGCSGLRLVRIGKGIKEIGSKAFANIFKNRTRTRADGESFDVYCEAEVIPSTAADAFEDSPINEATLHVADDLLDAYKYVLPWNGFGKIVGITGTGIRGIEVESEGTLIFDLQGNRLKKVRRGMNIIRQSEGKTMKVIVK